jgi:hypothetical protein
MRILLSCLQSPRQHAIPAYGFWRNYFVQGLQEAGHEILEVPGVDWARGITYPAGRELDSWRSSTWDIVEQFARRQHELKPIHLFIGYLFPKQIEVAAIAELQRIGIPCVNFFCDNVREFVKVPAEYRPFALHWVPEFEALAMYRKAALPFVHAPMPCWVSPELRSQPELESEPATFVGSEDVLRRDLLGRALEGGADFVVRGRGWLVNPDTPKGPTQNRSVESMIHNQIALIREHGFDGLLTKLYDRVRPLRPPSIPESAIRPPVSDSEYVRVTREAMVTIGVNRVATATHSPRRPLTYSRLRDIEAPMMGACYLTEWTAAIETLYEPGHEIETYRTAGELMAKLRELARDRARRKAMRERAQRRAQSEHSVGRSIGRIVAKLGL